MNAVQQTTVIQVGSQKSVGGAVALAFFFGPLGMLYATVPGALIMFVISIPILVVTLGFGLLITLPICAIWAGAAASSHNNQLRGVATQHSLAPAAQAAAPAGWHDDPEGSGRLRYYDGRRWTDRYAEQDQSQGSVAREEPALPQLEAGEEEEADEAGGEDRSEAPTAVVSAPQKAFCGACGHEIAATARFCSACGETQAVS